MSDEWLTKSACDLGREIDAGRIDPRDLTDTFIEAIRSNAYRDRIYARLTEARARNAAKAASERAKSGLRASLLDGVPISWKDLYDTAGTATESGSAMLKGRAPDRDAEVLTNASRAGLVCLGKTHQTELAFSGLGLNPVTETPPNAFDADLAPGGSSSGAAVSTAKGLAAAGIGSDTGGSVRIPAAWNDLVGLKTTHGLLSLKGVVPLCARFDTVGPLCRTVEDAAHLTAAMLGARPTDLKNASLKGRRFGVLETVALEECDPEVMAACDDAARKLEAAGATLDPIRIPEVAEALDLAGALYTVEAYTTWADKIEAEGDKMYPPVRARFEAGRDFSGVDYVRAWQRLDEIRHIYLDRTRIYDAILVPTGPTLPPNVQRLTEDPEYFKEKNLKALRNTRIGNLMGLCALTIPTTTRHVGLSLMGAPMSEALILRLGSVAEAAMRR